MITVTLSWWNHLRTGISSNSLGEGNQLQLLSGVNNFGVVTGAGTNGGSGVIVRLQKLLVWQTPAYR